VARSEFEKRAEQVTRQLEDIRARIDDLTTEYQAMLQTGEEHLLTTAHEMRENATDTFVGLRKTSPPGWVLVGILALIIVAVLLARNYLTPAPDSGEPRA
jgi:ElaB/YqjD/DUF883 family membrane-anchored ribosome-binding protein